MGGVEAKERGKEGLGGKEKGELQSEYKINA